MNSILLTTAVFFFPFWMQLSENGPLQHKQLVQPTVYAMDGELYPLLQKGLESGDIIMRRRIYSALASEPIPANREFLLKKCLSKEKDPGLRATIVRFLCRMEPSAIKEAEVAPLLKDSSPEVVLAAIKLYGLLAEAKVEKLKPFIGTPDKRPEIMVFEKAAWEAIAASGVLAEDLGNTVSGFSKAQDPSVRIMAFRAALSQKKRSSDTVRWISEFLKGEELQRIAVARDPNASDPSVAMRIIGDRNAAVRQAFCEAEASSAFPDALAAAFRDVSPTVRAAALKSIARCSKVTTSHLEAVSALFSDKSDYVRACAEDAFVSLAKKCSGAESILEYSIASSGNDLRIHSINAARRIGNRELASFIAAGLSTGDEPEVQAASLEALSELASKGEFGEKILPFVESSSFLVKRMTARALGRLQPAGAKKRLISLADWKNDYRVRLEAFEAMGHFPSMEFVPVLVECLRKVKTSSGPERAAAAWALGRIKPGTPAQVRELEKAASRMKTQCTVAVIPDVVSMFDSEDVLVNCFIALARLARNTGSASIKKDFMAVMKMYDVEPSELEELHKEQRSVPIPRSELTCSVARQARLWLEDKKVEVQPVPVKKLMLPLTPLEKRSSL